MGTVIRPELSKKNQYYLSRHRYYELKHFCAQYYEWKQAVDAIDGLATPPKELAGVLNSEVVDPTFRAAILREYYLEKMHMVEEAANDTDPLIGPYIFKHVTEELSYETLNAREQIPTNKDYYYDAYRKFFKILDAERG